MPPSRAAASEAKNGTKALTLAQAGNFILCSVLDANPDWSVADQLQWEMAAQDAIAFVEEAQLAHGDKGQIGAIDFASRIATIMRSDWSKLTYAEKTAWEWIGKCWFSCIVAISGVDVAQSAGEAVVLARKRIFAAKPADPVVRESVAQAIAETNGHHLAKKLIADGRLDLPPAPEVQFHVKNPSRFCAVIDVRIADLKAKIAALEKCKSLVAAAGADEALGEILDILKGD